MRSLRDLNLNSLRIVESAARTGSFTRAAEEQMLTPSAVSQRIKNLESQLRFKLFNRRHNSVFLTTEGDAFIAHVRDALDTILHAGLEARSQDREKVIKICTLPTFAVRWLLPRLQNYELQEPDIRLNISNSYSHPNFEKEDLDIAIVYGNGHFPGLKSKLLLSEELTPVCAPQLLQNKYPDYLSSLSPEALRHFTLLHSDTCTMNWQYWLEHMKVVDVLHQANSNYFDSCMLTYEAACAGLGFAIANRTYMMNDIANKKLVAPFSMHLKSGCGWYLVYQEERNLSPKIHNFEKWITRAAQHSQIECDDIFYSNTLEHH